LVIHAYIHNNNADKYLNINGKRKITNAGTELVIHTLVSLDYFLSLDLN